jgi:uncharacterized protein involved in type VI secretion and phage assembly
MSRVPGVVSGIVSSVDDPANLGRIQVQFDWMDGAPQSTWARIAAPMAGGQYGAFFMPEPNDEVLVSFDQGDVSSPYVVGFCWSGADQPPTTDVKQRCIKTVLGHQLIFDDNPGTNKITLTTPGKYMLTLDEVGGKITLATQNGVTVEVDDPSTGDPQIQLTLPTGNNLALSASGLSVTVASGTVSVTALSATISAPMVTIDAAMTEVTGVLSVTGPVLATGGVVAPTYTEGIGNFI